MDTLKSDFPDWAPQELIEHFLIVKETHCREKASFLRMTEDEWQAQVASWNKKIKIESMLLTDSRMKPVWKLFDEIEDSHRKRLNFFQLLYPMHLDALDRQVTSENQKTIEKYKKRLSRPIKNLPALAEEIDIFCSKLPSVTLWIQEKGTTGTLTQIKRRLLRQLNFYKKNVEPFRTKLFLDKRNLNKLKSNRKRAQKNYAVQFFGEAVFMMFEKFFNQPYYALANDVANVVFEVSADPAIDRLQQRDKVRSRLRVRATRLKAKK